MQYLKFFICMIVIVPSVYAHSPVVKKLHPVAESYLRINFILNLEPVIWEQIWPDIEQIAKHMEKISADEAKRFRHQMTRMRKQQEKNRLPIFDQATRAVALLCAQHLHVIGQSETVNIAKTHVTKARQILQSFAHVLPYSDPKNWKKIQKNWPNISSKDDLSKQKTKILFISTYLFDNYMNFTSRPGKLGPFPRNRKMKIPVTIPPGSHISKLVPRPRQILGMSARGVDESRTPLIALGDMAFDSPYIFGDPATSLQISCNTCHNKSITNPKFFIPGLSKRPGGMDVSNSFFAPHANNGVADHLDTPDLRGIRFTAPYGRNGRFASLREFVRNVIVNEFNGEEPSALMLDGIIAYMNEFEFLPNPKLNKDGTITIKASKKAKAGEKLFLKKFPQMMGGKSCADCHIPSSHFLDHRRHNIGSAKGFAQHSLDGAFDTPTLLSSKFTAPYFHDGSQPSFKSVVMWFDKRFKLKLTKSDVDHLTAYLEAIGDGVDPYEDSIYYLDAELEEFYFFLSTYEYLKKKGNNRLLRITFQTISNEVQKHTPQLRNRKYLPAMKKMAQLMDQALKLVGTKRSGEIDAIVREYRQIYFANKEHLK